MINGRTRFPELEVIQNISAKSSWEICQPLCKNTAGVRCKMQFAYYLKNTNSFHRCSEFCLFDELIDADK